jgi:hypothetical protein
MPDCLLHLCPDGLIGEFALFSFFLLLLPFSHCESEQFKTTLERQQWKQLFQRETECEKGNQQGEAAAGSGKVIDLIREPVSALLAP